jgi:pSer/pThr/pTyr-binding forkhead associated (FHA) protein
MDVTLERLDDAEDVEIVVETHDFTLADPDFVIGRADDCDLQLESDFVSRHHCRLIVDDRDRVVTVLDLGSHNGTFVNDGPVAGERRLKDGDKLVVGCIPFAVHIAVPALP